MAARKEKVSNNNIPDDIVFSILSKLPLKSLKRFISVTKSWADYLFENPNFMTMYLSKHDNDDNDNSSLLWNHIPQPYTSFRDNFLMLYSETFEHKVKLDWPPPFQDDDDINCIFMLGSVINGTICLYQKSDCVWKIVRRVVLWNPTTDEFKDIPPDSVDCPLGFEVMVTLHAFGYDPLTNDYKLIRRLGFHEVWNGYGEKFPEPSWQIYSPRNNSWKNLDDVEMPYKYCDEVYLNGMCHWLGLEEEMVLVSFNLSNEVCHKTPLDWNDGYEYRNWSRTLVALNNSIAMITMHPGTTCFDISILGELGVTESWTKIVTIGPLPCGVDPVGVWKKGNMFFWKNDDELAMFNLSTQMVEEIGVKDKNSYCQIVIYKESILPIGGMNS